MGCCLSTTNTNLPRAQNHHQHTPPETSKPGGAATHLPSPPPPLEEETVKEVVLSEPTSVKIPKAPALSDVEEEENVYDKVNEPEVQEVSFDSTVPTKPAAAPVPAEEVVSEVSEYSEMCSFTESLSKATTAPEKRDEDGEVTQKSPVRVQRKHRVSGEITGPREKSARSPARRGQAVTSSRADQRRQASVHRRNAGPRRGPVEGAARRSRSPATRGEVGARRNVRHQSPGVSQTGRTGTGVQSPAKTTVNNSDKEQKSGEMAAPENNESLENPVVSMECFIFL